MQLRTRRVYEAPGKADGLRVLVDRLWPRGRARADAAVDLWLREIAPSDALRRRFGHDPERWDAFREAYFAELEANGGALERLREALGRRRRLTLLYAARDRQHNNAVALAEYLRDRWADDREQGCG